MEAKADGIRISIIYPPDTDTPFLEYERANTLPESIALSKGIRVISAERVAQKYMNGLQKNKFEIYCDFNSRILRSFKNNLPNLFNYFTSETVKKVYKKNKA
jgi:3-dehydrosphinganine reductase